MENACYSQEQVQHQKWGLLKATKRWEEGSLKPSREAQVRIYRYILLGEDVCILMTDSHYCKAETNTALLSSYPPINFLKSHKASGNKNQNIEDIILILMQSSEK